MVSESIALLINVRNPEAELRAISTPSLSQATQAELFFAHPLTVVKDVPGWLTPILDFVRRDVLLPGMEACASKYLVK